MHANVAIVHAMPRHQLQSCAALPHAGYLLEGSPAVMFHCVQPYSMVYKSISSHDVTCCMSIVTAPAKMSHAGCMLYQDTLSGLFDCLQPLAMISTEIIKATASLNHGSLCILYTVAHRLHPTPQECMANHLVATLRQRGGLHLLDSVVLLGNAPACSSSPLPPPCC